MENPTVRRITDSADKEGWFYFAMDGRGRLISASKSAPASLQTPELWRHVDQFQAGLVSSYLTVVAKTPVGERLVLGISQDQLWREFFAYLSKALLVGAAIFLAASATGFWIISRGLRPIAQISETASRIAEGDLSGRIDVRSQRSELGLLARTLNGTFDRLSGALQRQMQFTADASHELRTPIAAIVADCQFSLKKERPPERYRETIEVCHESAQHMRLLIERLSLLARFDAHDSVLQKEVVDLKEVGECALAVVGPVAEEKGIRVEIDLESAEVTADRLRLEQVAINLVTNAVRYNKPEGSVLIRSGQSGRKAFIEVQDTGIGIPSEMLSRVFDRFFRVDDSRNSGTGGTGLGLAICKSIVEAHGGTVSVKSQLGEGSTFRIEFPLE
jgi:heavy metal sensor kinase